MRLLQKLVPVVLLALISVPGLAQEPEPDVKRESDSDTSSFLPVRMDPDRREGRSVTPSDSRDLSASSPRSDAAILEPISYDLSVERPRATSAIPESVQNGIGIPVGATEIAPGGMISSTASITVISYGEGGESISVPEEGAPNQILLVVNRSGRQISVRGGIVAPVLLPNGHSRYLIWTGSGWLVTN